MARPRRRAGARERPQLQCQSQHDFSANRVTHLMAGLIVAGVITLVSLITNYFFPERFRWRKIALLTIGILGVIWSFAQGYMSYQNVLQLRKKVTDLEAQQITRHLSPEQKATLIAALSPFSGQKVSLWCLISARDCNAFAEDFRSVFKEAKWDAPKIDFGTADYDVVGVEPILNEQFPDWPPNTPPIPAAAVLAETLYQLKLTKTRAINPHPDVPTDTILIRIGRIPQPK
jgi:hypothetical protein